MTVEYLGRGRWIYRLKNGHESFQLEGFVGETDAEIKRSGSVSRYRPKSNGRTFARARETNRQKIEKIGVYVWKVDEGAR